MVDGVLVEVDGLDVVGVIETVVQSVMSLVLGVPLGLVMWALMMSQVLVEEVVVSQSFTSACMELCLVHIFLRLGLFMFLLVLVVLTVSKWGQVLGGIDLGVFLGVISLNFGNWCFLNSKSIVIFLTMKVKCLVVNASGGMCSLVMDRGVGDMTSDLVMGHITLVKAIVLVGFGPVVSGSGQMGVASVSEAMDIVFMRLMMMYGRSMVKVGVEISSAMTNQSVRTMMSVVMSVVLIVLAFDGLHLKDKITARCVHIRWVEDAGVGLESSGGLVPAARVERIEVIAPVEFEFVFFLVVGKDLNIVVEHVPWHVNGVETSAPGVETWCPEVHSQGLSLVDEVDSLSRAFGEMADLLSINGEGDVFGRVLDFISVPVVMWVELMGVVVVLELVVTITVDHVGGEGVALNRGNNLDVDFVPTTRVEARAVPVGEEGSNGAFSVGCLHAGHELSVVEFLVGGDRATLKVGLGDSYHSE